MKLNIQDKERELKRFYPQGDPKQPDYSNVLAIAAGIVVLGSILYLILR